jgi:hypothetical protein
MDIIGEKYPSSLGEKGAPGFNILHPSDFKGIQITTF